MPFVRSSGHDIYYERHGAGPALLFLHGAGSNAATWWQQLPVFMQRFTCITMDIRCFGRSVAPLEAFEMRGLVDDCIAVLDALSIARVAVIGQSLGGMLGLRLALWHPQRIAAYIGTDTPMGIDHAGMRETLARRQQTHSAVSIEQRSLGAWFLQQRPALAALYAQINHFNPSAYRFTPEQWRAAMSQLLNPAALIPMDGLRAVACPTLFVVGSEDPLVSVAVMQEVQALIAGSEVTVIDAAGHSAYFEKPDEFNRRVQDFIDRRAGGLG